MSWKKTFKRFTAFLPLCSSTLCVALYYQNHSKSIKVCSFDASKLCELLRVIFCVLSSSNLYEGDVLGKLLFDVVQPLLRLSEGGEVGHHGAQTAVRHEAGQDFSRSPAQQVELDVQPLAVLLDADGRARLKLTVRQQPAICSF